MLGCVLLVAGCGGGGKNTANVIATGGSTIGNVTIMQDASGGDWSLRVPVSWTTGIPGLDSAGASKPASGDDLDKIEQKCSEDSCKSAIQKCRNDLGRCAITAQ